MLKIKAAVCLALVHLVYQLFPGGFGLPVLG
jgi:hypothetical protein